MDSNNTIIGVLDLFRKSIFAPAFYRDLKNESLRGSHNYAARFTLFITAASLIYIIITTFIQVQPSLYLLMFTVGLLLAAFAVYIVVFGVWVVVGWGLGLVFWIFTSWFTKSEPELVIKQALYATSLPCIFIPFMKELHLSYSIFIILPTLIFLVNVGIAKFRK